ncbi:hypothetical protein VZT92_007826 [Zoarces viviparus]
MAHSVSARQWLRAEPRWGENRGVVEPRGGEDSSSDEVKKGDGFSLSDIAFQGKPLMDGGRLKNSQIRRYQADRRDETSGWRLVLEL